MDAVTQLMGQGHDVARGALVIEQNIGVRPRHRGVGESARPVELISLDRQTTFGTFKMATNGPVGAPIGDYFGEVINPSEPYRFKVTGQSKKRRPFRIYYPRIFKPVQGPTAKAGPEQFGPPSGTMHSV